MTTHAENPFIEAHAHIGADGTLHLEGLHSMADQDVAVTLFPVQYDSFETDTDPEHFAASETGEDIAAKMRAFRDKFSKLPVLDDRSPDEILGYDESGLPS